MTFLIYLYYCHVSKDLSRFIVTLYGFNKIYCYLISKDLFVFLYIINRFMHLSIHNFWRPFPISHLLKWYVRNSNAYSRLWSNLHSIWTWYSDCKIWILGFQSSRDRALLDNSSAVAIQPPCFQHPINKMGNNERNYRFINKQNIGDNNSRDSKHNLPNKNR